MGEHDLKYRSVFHVDLHGKEQRLCQHSRRKIHLQTVIIDI